jgi:hypothetical protein
MSDRIDVTLALHNDVYARVKPWLVETERNTQARIAEALRWLGVPAQPVVSIVPEPGGRALRVLLAASECPYPPAFLARVWYAVAERRLREEAFRSVPAGRREVHTWLIKLAARSAGGDTERVGRALAQLVERVAPDVVTLHPAGTLTDRDAARWFDGAPVPAHGPYLLRGLLALGVAIGDRPRVALAVRAALALHDAPDRAFEEAFAALRSPAVEVPHDEQTFDALAPGAQGKRRVGAEDLRDDVAAALTVIQAHRLSKLGVETQVLFVRSRWRHECEMRIRVNDRRSPAIPLPSPDEVAVSAPPRVVERARLRPRRLIDPVTGVHLSAVGRDQEAALREAQLEPVPASDYAVAAFARGLAPLAYRLLTVHEVERMLARFEPESPVLVHAVLEHFDLMSLTRVLRDLVREGVSIDDLWRMLNAVLRYLELEEPERRGRVDVARLVAFLRRELADRIVVEACGLPAVGEGVVPVLETTPGFERRLEAWGDAPSEDELRAVRRATWIAVGGSPSDGQPVALTSTAAQRPLRIALDHEMPDVQVLARTEIVPGVAIDRLGEITI